MTFERVNPHSLAAPKGYNHGMLAPAGGRVLFVAGQIAWDEHGKMIEGDFVAQFEQALANVLTVVKEAGGNAKHVGRMTVYVRSRAEYLASLQRLGHSWRKHMGRHYPAMSLVEVSALLDDAAVVEIEAIAVIP